MKKILAGLMVLMSLCTAHAFADSDVKVIVNGDELTFDGQKAVIMGDYTMIPFRSIFESLDAYVQWRPSDMGIIASKGITTVKLQIDSDQMIVNGAQKTLPLAVSLVNDTTMVPLRAVSEILGSDVLWDGNTNTVTITTKETKGDHKADVQYLTKEYKNDNGDTLINAIVSYPVFSDDGKGGIAKLNSMYKQDAETVASQMISQFSAQASTDYQTAQSEGKTYDPMIVMYEYEVTFDQFGFLSLVEQGVINAQDVFYFDGVTFNSETADVVKKEDMVYMSQEEINSIEPYSFYLYQDQMVLFLNTNNIYLYQSNNYPPSMVVPTEYVKYNLLTGEPNTVVPADEPTTNNSTQIPNPRTEYKNIKDLNAALSFKMVELKDQIKDTPISFASIGTDLGEIIYSHDSGNAKVIVRKGLGDTDISGIYGAEKNKEETYKKSMITYYKNDTSLYATFSIEKDSKIFSYSVMVDNTTDSYLLGALSKEIIDSESL